ncbi:MAG: hypothetical protein NTX79_06890 [Candidatus Micrarchaeota archaeon]|nr:hypothetical protein [Candidatus Micrarchaeota archaeon]
MASLEPASLLSQFRDIAIFAAIACYIFAAGKITDFLSSSGKRMTKREVLVVPFAYVFLCFFTLLLYASSGAWVPPQNTIITMAAYLVLLPLALCICAGALALHGFFHDRLNPLQSLDLSMHIILAPLFDGLAGYWTAIGAAAVLVLASSLSFWSSGGNFSLVTLDFLIMSAIFSLYFLYRALTARDNEGRASNFVSMLVIFTPGVLRLFLPTVACALLSLIPIQFFKTCPLLQAGNEVTLALSVLATLVLLVPVIPLLYALSVNLLRAATAFSVLMYKEKPGKAKGKEEEE